MALVSVQREDFIIARSLMGQYCCGESLQHLLSQWGTEAKVGDLVAPGISRSPEPSLLRASGHWGTGVPRESPPEDQVEDAFVGALQSTELALMSLSAVCGDPLALWSHVWGTLAPLQTYCSNSQKALMPLSGRRGTPACGMRKACSLCLLSGSFPVIYQMIIFAAKG